MSFEDNDNVNSKTSSFGIFRRKGKMDLVTKGSQQKL